MSVNKVEGNIPMSDIERAYREYLLTEKMRKLREDIIDRLVNLQTGVEQMKDYKVIDEDMLFDVRIAMDEEMER